tara:strand:+ start:371 stop:829 length:459 start_codon:yes stop_codon:yes gene_type:complete
MFRKTNSKKIFIVLCSLFFLSIASAEDIFLSLKKNKVNVRYGPSFDSPIKFIFKKIDLPIKQIDKKDNFRRIIDHKKNSGWIHISQLKKVNSLILLKDEILFKKPSKFSKPLAIIKKGRILVVQKCKGEWCKIKIKKFKGWIETTKVWGRTN